MYKLVRADSGEAFSLDLPLGRPVVIGRGADVDLTISDPTLSRRHASFKRGWDQKVALEDLGSSNGTFLNGARVATATIAPGDTVSFGKATFRFEAAAAVPDAQSSADATVLRQRAVRQRPAASAAAAEGTTVMRTLMLPAEDELTQRKLALLLDVSTALSRAESVDALLGQIAEHVFEIMKVDRLAILLNENDELVTRVARDRQGGETARVVPRTIARRVVQEKIAVISANTTEDQRFASDSIVMQSVRSAMCAPLIGREGVVLGVLYVDNVTAAQSFDDDDLAFLVAFCGIVGVAIENGQYSERIRREMLARGNFERFFTPALAARIAGSVDSLRLGGENRRVTVLFSDIRGFTQIAENVSPEDLATLLNEYFTVMVDCVFRHGGTLDKFIGDALLAQWGAPVSSDQDADHALAAAYDMLEALSEFNARRRTQAMPQLDVGIGLNVGDVFAGYIGSERRLEYTILGDAVNVANRLCNAASGGEILVSDALLEALRQKPAAQERTGVQLKGVTRPVRVFALGARSGG